MEVFNAAGSDVKENRPVYSFGKTEAQKEEDWLVEMQLRQGLKLKSKPAVSSPELTNVKTIKVEEITLSAGIDESVE